MDDNEEKRMTEPEDPISALAAGAVALHELMLAFVDAGFTDAEAFQLVRDVLERGTTQ